jgi:hypothetical protein
MVIKIAFKASLDNVFKDIDSPSFIPAAFTWSIRLFPAGAFMTTGITVLSYTNPSELGAAYMPLRR